LGARARIADAEQIRRIFRALAREHAVGTFAGSEVRATLAGFVTRAETGITALRWTCTAAPPSADAVLDLAGALSLFRCPLELESQLDGRLETKVPSFLERLRTRSQARVRAPTRVVVHLRPSASRSVDRELHDVSRDGIAFAVANQDSVYPGSIIEDASIDWQGRLRIRADLVVKHVSEKPCEGRRIAGAVATFASPEDAAHWELEVEPLVDPNVRTGGTWSRDLWELFEKSGYFSLSNRSPQDFFRLRGPFVTVSRKLSVCDQSGIQAIWPSGRGIEASSSVAPLNDETVFMYQLGRRHGSPPLGGSGRAMVHAVFSRTIRWIISRRAFRWVVAWVQDAGRFSKRLQLDFVRRHENGTDASVIRFRVLQVPTRLPAARAVQEGHTELPEEWAPAAKGWAIRAAGRADQDDIRSAAIASLPSSFVAAHAIGRALEEPPRAIEECAPKRGREVLVAELDGRVHAAATVDWAEEGLHLYGLFDVLRIIPMGPLASQTAPLLLERARQRYAALAKEAFVFAADADADSQGWPAGASDLGVTYCTVMSSELLPLLAEHSWELAHGGED
jgi:hypothetical protein